MVAIADTDGAAEAAWKYVLIASAGLGLVFFPAEDGIRDGRVTGVQTCALPISRDPALAPAARRLRDRRGVARRWRATPRHLDAGSGLARPARGRQTRPRVHWRRSSCTASHARPRARPARRPRARERVPHLTFGRVFSGGRQHARETTRRRAALVIRLHLDAAGGARDAGATQAPPRAGRAVARAPGGAAGGAGETRGGTRAPPDPRDRVAYAGSQPVP